MSSSLWILLFTVDDVAWRTVGGRFLGRPQYLGYLPRREALGGSKCLPVSGL